MILGFSTKFPKGKGALSGKETHFARKILNGLSKEIKDDFIESLEVGKLIKFNNLFSFKDALLQINQNAKLHTIREDKKDRWKVGNDIHFSINVRTKNQLQFAPVVKVKSIQKVEMVIRGIKNERPINVYVDGKIIGVNNGLKELAINDGFDTLEDFYDYFKDGFTGKIIHWTDLKY